MSIKLEHKEQIDQLYKELTDANESCIGYPLSKDFDYSSLYRFFKYSINNIGDPFEGSNIKTQTHIIEKEVVDFFGQLLGANPNDYWGYVTHGGSESNLYSLYVARELYPNAIVYYSDATHYCVRKSIGLLNIEGIMIRTQENGEISYEDLENTLKLHRSQPAIIVSNFGTTMTEAKDDISKIKNILKSLAMQDYHIHCDAALAGAYGSFITPRLPFDLSDGADSISISGHKFIGSPMPSGILITKRSLRDRIAKKIPVIDSIDTTIAGSRNGHSSLFLWYAIKNMGIEGLKNRYLHSLEVAEYCLEQLLAIGIDAWKLEGAITVVFPKISDRLKSKWQLATVENLTHIICMPNVTKEQIDSFINDVKNDETFLKMAPTYRPNTCEAV